MSDIEFGELPGGEHRYLKGGWVPIFDALRARPGEWAKVRTAPTAKAAHSMASNIRTGVLLGSVRNEFETAQRGCDVWARYVGGAS